jgi:hypothetical protein
VWINGKSGTADNEIVPLQTCGNSEDSKDLDKVFAVFYFLERQDWQFCSYGIIFQVTFGN